MAEMDKKWGCLDKKVDKFFACLLKRLLNPLATGGYGERIACPSGAPILGKNMFERQDSQGNCLS